jgi:putative glycosyltransferase (TIGR04372 family)
LKILKVVFRKLYKYTCYAIFLFFSPIFLIIVGIIRIILPIVNIRLRVVDSHRLGHFTSELDFYNIKKAKGEIPEGTIDIFGFDEHGKCNTQLAKMWARRMIFLPFVSNVVRVNKLFSGWEKQEIPWITYHDENVIRIPKEIFIQFTNKEENRGQKLLKEIIGSTNKKIVCLFNRDSEYLNRYHTYRKWDYHNYRDSNIDNYKSAMEWLAEQGYIVLRMGKAVAQPLPNVSESIIDYAISHRSDFMDIYLFSKCEFMVGSYTGPSSLGAIFRKPAAHVNCCPFLTLNIPASNVNELFIPKLYYTEKKERILSIEEIVSSDLDAIHSTEIFQEHKIKLIENDSIDILNEIKEIEGLVSGRIILTEDDIYLQKEFWRAARINYDDARFYAQPSPSFLKKHYDVLFKT